jgi:NitT/TauT family transport system substrate-binding protein
MSRASTSCSGAKKKDVDGRDKPGHDAIHMPADAFPAPAVLITSQPNKWNKGGNMPAFIVARAALLSAALVFSAQPARAEDALKVAIGQRGVYENSISELGQDRGFFKRRGLALELLYTQGGGETQQAVISGAVDIGIGVGTLGAMGAFAKGAPVRVLGATMRGAYEYWYVPAASPIKTFRDADGKTVAYSTNGSSTNLIVLALARHYGVTVKPTATGSPVSTLTQTMTGQVDVGWSAAPIGVGALAEGKIRIVARGNDVPAFADQTVRFVLANADALDKRPDVFRRYMQAYRDTLDWMYADPASLAAYAGWAGVSESVARRTRDDFIPKDNANPDRISGLEAAMADAVAYKFLPAPLDAGQLKTLIRLQEAIR